MEDVITTRERVFRRISEERDRQTVQWGDQWEPGRISPLLKLAILGEEFGEISRELCENGSAETDHLAHELTQLAAVAVAWLESMEPLEPEHPRDYLPATHKQLNYLQVLIVDVLDGGMEEWQLSCDKHFHELTRAEASDWIGRLSGRAV